MLGLEEWLVKRETSQGGCFALGHHDGEFELSNECAWLFHDDWIRNQKLVLETFLESESSYVWIFKAVHAEAEGRISAKHVVEELSALLDFQIVGSVKGSLVHIGSDFSLNKSKSTYLVFPSPLLTKTSRAKTSLTWNSWSSTFCSKVSLLMMTLLPSIRCFLRSWEITPSRGDTS